mgnify:CR=1 FL=1
MTDENVPESITTGRNKNPAGEPETVPLKKRMSIQEAVNKRSWDALAEMAAGGDWAAEVALNVAAAFWPSGKAAKALKA